MYDLKGSLQAWPASVARKAGLVDNCPAILRTAPPRQLQPIRPVPFEPHSAAPQHRLRPVSAVVRAVLLLAAGSAWQGQAAAEAGSADAALQLQPSLQLQERLPGGPDMAGPTFLSGDQIEGQTDVRTLIEGHAELRRHEMVLKAERLEHAVADDTVRASGGVRINRLGNIYEGPELQLKLDSNEGYFLQPRFTLLRNGGQGEASRLDFLGQNRASADNAVYSTCPRPGSGPWHPDWWISARKMEFDSETDTGIAHGGVLHFKGLPILGAPYVEFPLSDARRSGLLPPSINSVSVPTSSSSTPYSICRFRREGSAISLRSWWTATKRPRKLPSAFRAPVPSISAR